MPPDAALGTGTMLGFGIPAHAGPAHAASPERSPWAPPASDAPAAGPTAVPAAGPAAGPTVMPAVVGAVPVAAVPAAPVMPPPLLAAPLLGSGKKSNKSSDPKSRFRETMWFKKGELDAQAAQAAAEARVRTGKDGGPDKADSLPIDERYKDDGTLSRSDKEKYSLRTGATMSNMAVQDPGASTSHKVSESALIDELKSGRNRVLAIIAAVVVAIVLLIALIAR